MAFQVKPLAVVIALSWVLSMQQHSSSVNGKPQVPCFFIFGDSLADSGNNNLLDSLAKVNYTPYGIDFPGGATGRFTNGRTTIDVLSQLLGFDNYIPPFSLLNSSDILKGLNYASGAAGIRKESGRQLGARISMDRQLKNHKITISRIADILGKKRAKSLYLSKYLYKSLRSGVKKARASPLARPLALSGSSITKATSLSQMAIRSSRFRNFLPIRLFSLGKTLIFFCKTAAAATVRKLSGRGADQVPLLMLPKRIDAAIVQFCTLRKGKIHNFNLPEIRGKACFASLGWLVTVITDEGELKFKMLHPSNHKAQIDLPGLLRYPLENIWKFVLSSNPRSKLDYIVMFQTSTTLGFCRPGLGQGWKDLIFEGHNFIRDLTYYQGNFYVVDHSCRVSVVCEIEDPKRAHLSVVAPEIPNMEELLGPQKGIKQLYLVESAGFLLLVFCIALHHRYELTIGCRVFKVPFSNGNSWSNSEVKNLGNRALFLSNSSSSFSIEVSGKSGCKPNCIYFMNNKRVSPFVDLDVGIFKMEDGTIDRDFSNSFKTGFEEIRESPLWIQPCF